VRYSLRTATDADALPMMRIGHEGLRPYVEALWGWDRADQEARFFEHFVPQQILIVEVNGEAVGYVKLLEHDDHWFLEGIYLAAATRGRGLGTRILTDVMARTAASRKPLRLRVLRPNPAQRLYLRLGFTVTGETDTHLAMEFAPDAR